MGGRLRQWGRYPFAAAGPLSAGLAVLTTLVGIVSAFALPPVWQIWPGLVAFGGAHGGIKIARRRFMKSRDMVGQRFRRPVFRQAAGLAAVAAPFAVVIALRWSPAWSWPLVAASLLVYEAELRWQWAKRGYPGDPRWASDWSVEADPAYKFRALSPLRAGRYEEAQHLFQKALEKEPGDRSTLYNLACAEALDGRADAALSHLSEATSKDEGLLEQAQSDPDLASIRDDPRFPR